MRSLTLSLIVVVVAAVIGLGWLIGQFYAQASNDSEALGSELAGYRTMGSALALTLDNSTDSNDFLERWQAHSGLLISLQESANFPIPAALQQNFENGKPLVLESDGDVSLHFYLQNSDRVMNLVVPTTGKLQQRSVSNLALTLLFYLGVIAIVLVWLYPLIRRLMLLRRTARAFGQGDLAVRVTTSRFSYIADIEQEFNRMADRIQTLISDNKLLSSAVSHDLKTPLARLRFGIDMLEETQEPSSRDKYGQRIDKDLLEMESLVETLLQYARLDEANIKLHKECTDLKSFTTQLFDDLDDDSIDVQYRFTNAKTIIDVDRRYLAIQLNNVISNALSHAKGAIRVSVTATTGIVTLTIEDDGDGIPVDERQQVTKPFWRGSNSAAITGHGMGLAIVARIADWLDAKLEITESKQLSGAAIALHFKARR